MTLRVLLLTIALSISNLAIAQDSFYYRSFEKKWKINYGVGAARYLGDLSFEGGKPEFKGAINLEVEKKINPWVQIRAAASYFTLHSAKTFQPEGTYDFQSRNWTVSGIAVLNLVPNSYRLGGRLDRAYFGDNPIIPYVFGGFGVGSSNVNTTLNREEIIPQATDKLFIVLPMGTGIRWRPDTFFELGLEGSLHMTNTDLLDNISTLENPVAVDDVSNASLVAKGDFDHYVLIQAKMSYYLPFNFMKHKKAVNRNMKYWKYRRD